MLIRTIDQGPRLLVLMLLVPPVKLFVTGSLCATGELGINVVLKLRVGSTVKDAVIGPENVGIVMDADVQLPGCGLKRNRAYFGAVGVSPMKPRAIAVAGAVAHGWLHERFGF